MKDYPLFIPPGELSEKIPKQWNSKEAEQYFNWLLSIIEERTNNLLDYFEEKNNGDFSTILGNMGIKEVKELSKKEFAVITETGPKLINRGYALAADMGLLVARFLLESCEGKVSWSIVKKPKNDMSCQLPVLIGFGAMYLET